MVQKVMPTHGGAATPAATEPIKPVVSPQREPPAPVESISVKAENPTTASKEDDISKRISTQPTRNDSLDSKKNTPMFSHRNRRRVVSLDRGQDALMQDKDDDSDVSSDGESSYFAKHLPSPKSSRLSFDAASTKSAPARAAAAEAAREYETAASLSFSDDDEDEQARRRHEDLYFRGIVRMHSPSSLVSADEEQQLPPEEPELQRVRHFRRLSSGDRPHNNPNHIFNATRSPLPPHASPPLVLEHYHPMTAIHPQPLTAEQMQAWIQQHQEMLRQTTERSLDSNDSAKQSYSTLPMVYSEDEDTGVPEGKNGGGGPRSRGAFRSGQNHTLSAPPAPASQRESRNSDNLAVGAENSNHPTSSEPSDHVDSDGNFKVYWQRWIMLFYMSVLNLLSDWTCYSVAPISLLTQEAFGKINPEQLVVIFLSANSIASVLEPILLSRVGLRRTVVFGGFLLMLGSLIKSGGLPPIFSASLHAGKDEWRVYLGFFLVGLSQPLYQCTPALLSASWFPEEERTMATGVALNANQVGIGLAFVFGTILVASADDIVPYFGLLSIMSTITFIGSLIQFDDAPPTPPSGTAKVMKGDMKFPVADQIWQSVRSIGSRRMSSEEEEQKTPKTSTSVSKNKSASTRRRAVAKSQTPTSGDFRVASAPSSASSDEPTQRQSRHTADLYNPYQMRPGPIGQVQEEEGDTDDPFLQDEPFMEGPDGQGMPLGFYPQEGYGPYPLGYPYPHPPPGMVFPQYQYLPPQQDENYQAAPPPGYVPQGYVYMNYQPSPYYVPQNFHPYYHPTQYYNYYPDEEYYMPYVREELEPRVIVTDHHLDIRGIKDDQVIRQIKASFARRGFVHAVVTFTVSGVVINTLSTFMDYLVRLNGAGREYVGIVGGSFQFVIMISSLVIGKQTDNTRAYYSVTIAMLVLGAFSLAECGVSLDADRGGDLRWALIVVAALVGPLQPVSTELGVEVVYPLSENTVLVIQQLFSNLLSALFIPFFKALKDVGTSRMDATELYERPQYTFSFYLLIVLHAAVTVFFATFNGRYLRYEHELQQKAEQEQKKARAEQETFEKQLGDRWNSQERGEMLYPDERQPLMQPLNRVI
jgi:hypothetical protein